MLVLAIRCFGVVAGLPPAHGMKVDSVVRYSHRFTH